MEEARDVKDVSQEELITQGQEVAEANAQRAPEEIAATIFSAYYPSYRVLLGKLNKKDAMRLADALVAWPLEIEQPRFHDKKNGDLAFRLGIQLLSAKNVMASVVQMEQYNQSLAIQASGDEQSSPNNDAVNEQGENNG